MWFLLSTWCTKGTSRTLGVVNDTTSLGSDLLQVDRPHRELLDQVLDKWSLQVLDELCGRPLRFNELRRTIPTIGQKSLTATLRRLERNGIVERAVLGTRPIAVEYRITALGKTLRPPVDAILRWAADQMPAIETARNRFDDEVDEGS